mgnify:CR=1 FL=1|tara:strand:+ start:2780 stop:3130 length:351 start_codon:yes stop_codon:yes gene_type:complete
MKDFNPDNEKHMEIVQETEQAMKEEAKKQMEEVPRLENGRPDFMTMIEEMFPEQLQVVSYVKGICKGYALDMSTATAMNFKEKLESGAKEIKLHELIPHEIAPTKDDEKVTRNDIN